MASTAQAAAMDITPLSDALGAEVTGIDLEREQPPEIVQALRDAFAEYLVLVVRGQSGLSPEAQIRFCEFFGPVGRRARADSQPETGNGYADRVMYVSNRRDDSGGYAFSLPEGEMQFHIDQCYIERPARATTLYADVIPDEGGDTYFANLCRAYDTLPDDLRAIADTHKARHIFTYGSTSRDQIDPANMRSFAQPMAVRQPETGKKSLFLCRLMTDAIEGMDEAESRDTLSRLFDHVEDPARIYAHKWRQGDLLIWDNLCTMHGRGYFDPAKERHLRRFTIAGAPLQG